MDEAYEYALACEGEHNGALSEDQWLAWEEQMALAVDVAAKKRLVLSDKGRVLPDFAYRIAMCTLLEVQELLDQKTSEGAQAAESLLEAKREELDGNERDLMDRGLEKKARRVKYRRAVLMLEAAIQLSKRNEEIQRLSQSMASTMGTTLSDDPPRNVEMTSQAAATLPTQLNLEDLSTEALVANYLTLLAAEKDKGDLQKKAKKLLSDMKVYAREIFFAKVYSGSTELSADSRWVILELLLDEYTFDFTEIDGYLDLVIEDMKRETEKKKGFGSRKAHKQLSLQQLHSLLESEPRLVQSDVEYAIWCAKLMLSANEDEKRTKCDLSTIESDEVDYNNIERCVTFLEKMGPEVNVVRVALLHAQLHILRFQEPSELLWSKFLQYVQIPRFGVDFVSINFLNQATGDAMVVYNGTDATFAKDHGVSVQPASPSSIDDVSISLGLVQITAETDLQLVKHILHNQWASKTFSEENESTLRQYLSSTFLNTEKPLFMVKSGCGDLADWIGKLPKKGAELPEWSIGTDLSFCESSPLHLRVEDELNFVVRVRNVQKLTVHVYEIRTIDYYSMVRKEVQRDICLDGLMPNEELHVDLSHLSPWQEKRVPIQIAGKSGRRGVFVVEVFEKGMTCRAILRKGFLRHVKLVSARGHEFTVFDEQGNLVRDASVKVMSLKEGEEHAQTPRTYEADEYGTIVVPFHQKRYSSGNFGIVLCQGNFGFFANKFRYLGAHYELRADMHINSEQLRPGDVAQLMIIPQLFVYPASHPISLDVLSNVKVKIEFNGLSSGSGQVERDFGRIQELLEATIAFEVPQNAADCHVELSANIVPYDSDASTTSKLSSVHCSERFQVQRIAQFNGTYTPHFFRRGSDFHKSVATASDFYVSVLGHNGEPIADKEVRIKLYHTHVYAPAERSLQTDSRGEIRLGALKDIKSITVAFPSNLEEEWKWDLPNCRQHHPRFVHCSTGEQVEIPLPIAYSDDIGSWIANRQIVVCKKLKTARRLVFEDVTSTSRLTVMRNGNNEAVGVSFVAVGSGNFVCKVRPLGIDVPIAVAKIADQVVKLPCRLLITSDKLALESSTRSLSIQSSEVADEVGTKLLRVQIANATPERTTSWLVCKRFIELSRLQKLRTSYVDVRKRRRALVFEKLPSKNEYLTSRRISDEYSYILQRRGLLKTNPSSLAFVGSSSLPMSTLVQNPVVLDQSDMDDLVTRNGDNLTTAHDDANDMRRRYDDCTQRMMCGAKFSRGQSSLPRICASEIATTIRFLPKTSQMVISSTVDNDGVASFCLSDIPFLADTSSGQVFEATIVVADHSNGQLTWREDHINLSYESTAILSVPTRDVRLAKPEALTPGTKMMQQQRHECLYFGDSRTFNKTPSSKYVVYETMSDVIALWKNLCADDLPSGLTDQLQQWSTMNEHAKTTYYFANSSDELNFFLYWKDRPFFDLHVKRLVQGKLVKSLLDYYVLEDHGAISTRYLAPGMFKKLSVVEKLLVASRVESAEVRQRICQRVIKDTGSHYSSSDAKTQLSRIFDTVLTHRTNDSSSWDRSSRMNNAIHHLGYAPSTPQNNDRTETETAENNEEKEEDSTSKQKVQTDLKRNAQPYILPGKVRRVQEKRFLANEKPDLDGRNMFWRDYAVHLMNSHEHGQATSPTPPFLSSYFPEALHSMTEGVMALSILGLAIDAVPTDIHEDPTESIVRFDCSSNVVLYYQCMGEATINEAPNTALLVKEKIVLASEATDAQDVLQLRGAHEFVVNRVYRCIVEVINVTSSRVNDFNLLMQVPHGSIPLTNAAFYTTNKVIGIEPHKTNTYEFDFYFPLEGTFAHYPAQLSKNDKVVAWAHQGNAVTEIVVLPRSSVVDMTSWNDVSARGSLNDVIEFMEREKDITKLSMETLQWRCQDDSFYNGLVQYFRDQFVYVEGVWKYSLKHGDVTGINEYCSSSDAFSHGVGAGVSNALISTNNLYTQERFVKSFSFDHTEFGPFINRRAHRVCGEVKTSSGDVVTVTASDSSSDPARIQNKKAREYYRTLCHVLAEQATLSADQLLVMTYFMILFNRTSEAMDVFERLEFIYADQMVNTTENTIAFDYIDSYLDFFRTPADSMTTFSRARHNVVKYAELVHDRWRLRFERIAEVLNEFDEMGNARTRTSASRQEGHEATDPARVKSNEIGLDATVDGDTIHLKSQNVGACEISFYPIDVELMFSTEPFDSFSDAAVSKSSLTLIEPYRQIRVDFNGDDSSDSFEVVRTASLNVPSDLVTSQMLIRVRERPESRSVDTVAAPIDLTRAYFNTQLQVSMMTQAGILQVTHNDMPVSSCYVKVFAKTSNKTVFYKDGYTDVLGKFDYAAINGDLLTRVEKLAILVSHPHLGVMVQQVNPPVLATSSSEFQGHDDQRALWY